ncbi:hypothetical protein DSO57_1017660 [Entomophthora muscae]|uniref:Uncharacterized protein n=1 Tax=Entomophthora muscae TaxID=34485 RepID=A0ACC2TT10_9FUNG|nr:hypothetical protein DSO57_1017660 [Entomophthora muscae]
MSYATIDGASATKRDPTFYTRVSIPCVEPGSQDAVVPAKGRRWLTDSECEALLNCLNGGMAVWDIASQFGVTARYIANINTKYGNTGQIAKSTKAKRQPKLLQPVHIDTIKQWVAVVIHMYAVLQARVDLASNKDNMLKSDNVWLAGDTVN